MTDKMENMTNPVNPRVNDTLRDVIEDTLREGSLLEHKSIDLPAVMLFCKMIHQQLPQVEADLKARFPEEGRDNPDHFLPEAVMALIHLSWDYGFRAGRIFEARDYGLSEEEKDL